MHGAPTAASAPAGLLFSKLKVLNLKPLVVYFFRLVFRFVPGSDMEAETPYVQIVLASPTSEAMDVDDEIPVCSQAGAEASFPLLRNQHQCRGQTRQLSRGQSRLTCPRPAQRQRTRRCPGMVGYLRHRTGLGGCRSAWRTAPRLLLRRRLGRQT